MVFFALILPVLLGFMALSLAASIELNTKAQLDQASLTAAIAASSDACMTSQYVFDTFECKNGKPNYGPIEPAPGQLPEPCFSDSGSPCGGGPPPASFGSGGVDGTLSGPLSADVNYHNLTITGNVNTNGHVIYATGTVTISAGVKVSDDGVNGTTASGSVNSGGGAGLTGGTLGGSGAGGNGGNNGIPVASPCGSAVAGSPAPGVNLGIGGHGGNGGPGNGVGGGSYGAITPPSLAQGGNPPMAAATLNTYLAADQGGSGGGGGGSGTCGGHFGGGGGSGGGIVEIAAENGITNNGTIEAVGGNGGAGSLGAGLSTGGGGGGGGGVVYLITSTPLASTGTVNVNGGSGGAGAKLNGNAGTIGKLVKIVAAPSGPTTPYHPVNTTCTGAAPNQYCVIFEHDMAMYSADITVHKILAADYPGFNVVLCAGETHSNVSGYKGDGNVPSGGSPGAVPVLDPTASCAGLVANSKTIVFQDQISYWYYLDTDDAPSGGPTALTDTVTDDIGLPLSQNGGGTAAPDGDGDSFPIPPGQPTNLVCPATGQLGRLVSVHVWSQFRNPFGGILGTSTQGLTTSSDSYGCTS